MGYHRAGFDVTGLDIADQPHYPFRFVRGDALRPPFDLREFAAIHASPPCQAYSRSTAWRGDRSTHPDLIAATRTLLLASGRPYAIENVQEARRLLRSPVMLCGTAFGLSVRRHRWFELSVPVVELTRCCEHRRTDYSHDHGGKQTEAAYRQAMGCEWMTVHEARQAIPPVMAEWVGRQLMAALKL
jgi:hypothetical protein